MTSRVLLVTFQQALRSIALSLLPITSITLIGWALAGSQTGNTSDPLRASIWFWLAAHLIPFTLKLAPGYVTTHFNCLPIAAVLIPFLTLRSSFKRASEELQNPRAARSFITLWYGLLTTLTALAMQSESVKPVLYLAPIYGGALALIATIDFKSEIFASLKYLANLFLIIFGISLITLTYLLVKHFSVLKSLTVVSQPGLVGGLLLVLIQILYLPNIIFALISYVLGFGFALGAGTLVSPLTVKLNGIPAIPILAALPSQKFKFALLLILIPTIALLLNQIYWLRGIQSVKEGLAKISKGLLSFLILALFFGYQSGGTFFTKALNPFGIKWWSLVCALLVAQIFVTLFFYLLPTVIRKAFKRNV